MRKVGSEFWEQLWRDQPLPPVYDPSLPGIRHHLKRTFHRYFSAAFKALPPRSSLLEAGCGRSQLLPYFAREFGFDVAGIDYATSGCESARLILARENISGTIHEADFFQPPSDLLARFDVVFSYGVVEHFDPPVECLAALARFLKPGGMLVTLVPNMAGFTGSLQKWLNRPVFDIHNPLDRVALARATADAQLQVTDSTYLGSVNFGVCSLKGVNKRSLSGVAKQSILVGAMGLTALVWKSEELFGPFTPGERFSPYVSCIGIARGRTD